MPLFLLSLTAAPAIQAQSCPNIPSGGSESISATITIDGTSTVLTEEAFVAVGTRVRIDSVAQADGTCTGMALYCDGGCACDETGYVYDRTINHTNGLRSMLEKKTVVRIMAPSLAIL